MVEDTPIHSF